MTLMEIIDLAYKTGYADCLQDREISQLPPMPPNERAELIIQICCRYFNVQFESMKVRCRKRKVLYPRHVTLFLLAVHSGYSCVKIGRLFLLDHTTVLHARNVIIKLIQSDSLIKDEVNKLEEWIDAAVISRASTAIEPKGPRIYKPKGKPKPVIVPVQRKPMIVAPERKVPLIRPRAEYSNRSPYGIANEMR